MKKHEKKHEHGKNFLDHFKQVDFNMKKLEDRLQFTYEHIFNKKFKFKKVRSGRQKRSARHKHRKRMEHIKIIMFIEEMLEGLYEKFTICHEKLL